MSKKKNARAAEEEQEADLPPESRSTTEPEDSRNVIEGGSLIPSETIGAEGGVAPAPVKPIEGGSPIVGGSEQFVAKDTKPPSKEQVQANLATYLMLILGLTILVHYSMTTFVWYHTCKADEFEQHYKPLGQIFNTLLPILSGLVSSAITYYFTREIQSSKQETNQPKPS